MSSLPSSNTQLKIPSFNTNSIRLSQLTDRHSVTKQVVQPTVKKNQLLTTTPVNRVTKTTHNGTNNMSSTATNITTTKISVDGKVIDIDVLTKLQQHNGGNIVSFTASKEFLSNLASTKMNNIRKATTQHNNVASKKIAVTVYGTQAKHVVQHAITGKISQEKRLLPKTTQSTTHVYPLPKCQVEIKKFAPEMNGLLTGLSTALKTSSTATTNVCDNRSTKSLVLKKNHLNPVSINVMASKGKIQHKTVYSSMNNFTTSKTPKHIATTTNTHFTSRNTLPKLSNDLIKTINIGTSIVNTTMRSQQVKPKTLRHQYSGQATPTSAIVENKGFVKRDKINKVIQENEKKTSFKIQKLLQNKNTTFLNTNCYSDLMPSSSSTQSQTHSVIRNTSTATESIKKEGHAIKGFNELYETAVSNVLNIKAFPDDLGTVKNGEDIRNEFEQEFKHYLETPMDIEQKINDGVFKYLHPGKRMIKSEYKGPARKKPKVTDTFGLKTLLTGQTSSSNTDINFEVQKPSNVTNVVSKDTIIKGDTVDNRKFFAQFLSDQSVPKPYGHAYYSPMDFPWFYPSYIYESYYRTPVPPPPPTSPPCSTSAAYVEQSIKIEEKGVTEKSEQTTTTLLRKSAGTKKRNTKQTLNTTDSSMSAKLRTGKGKNNIRLINTVTSEKHLENKNKHRVELLKETNHKNNKTSEVKRNSKKLSTNKIDEHPKKHTSSCEKRLKNRDNLKFRYSLRQRAKALKKAKKFAKLRGQDTPKFILKKLDKRTSTKKELFLACLGLRRILKRVEVKVENK